jgi:alkanesulfonate monooxygenase SsuD/methylene tetrahydromethanopterin reductase-like flavin-dependent oxidoreductase (luciferase family)
MRIGLTGGGNSADRIVEQAQQAEADGFSHLWYPSAVLGDPLAPMALAGKATTSIELGTSVLVTYMCHPVLQANRALSTAATMGRDGLVLGVGPSHKPVIEDYLGLSYDGVGAHTENYATVVGATLKDKPVTFMISALAPRLLRVAGEQTDGTILWMANAKSIASHVAPRITKAAANAGKAAPRIVAGLPVAVCDDEAEGRAQAAKDFANYGLLPNYRRILDIGEATGPGDAAIVGDEASVTAQITALFEAGATDVWCAPFVVGADRSTSRRRTRDLLNELARA